MLYLCQSPYNFFRTTYSIKRLVNEAKNLGIESLILLENTTLAGSLEFYQECQKNEIKGIICLEISLKSGTYWFFPRDLEGFKSLFSISTFYSLSENILKNTRDLFLKGNVVFFKKKSATNKLNNEIENWMKKYSSQFKGFISDYIIVDKIFDTEQKILDVLATIGKLEAWKNGESLVNMTTISQTPMFQAGNLLDTKVKELPDIIQKQNWEFFRSMCIKGLKKRFASAVVPKKYYDRLVYEMSIVKKKGLESYFLIFYDLVQHCYEKGILIGPGRGSAAGSLIAYCLHITNIDPIKHDLLFERFLNPMRSNLPDIDLDIEDINRDQVVYYLFERYGTDRVANIATYSSFGLKGAFREVAKVLELNNVWITDVSELLPASYFPLSLNQVLSNSNLLLEKFETNDKVKQALEIANEIRDIPRHSSIHAAGVVLTKKKMSHILPLYLSKNQTPTTQWKMDEIEKWGIAKLDILGLRNLTIIKNTIIGVYQNRNIILDIYSLSKKDYRVFRLLGSGEVDGIFQLESAGMRKVLRKIKPSSIEEIGLVSALFRPGAQKHIDKCAQNKFYPNNRKKVHPVIDKILKTTFGVLVYQEQVMQIMVEFAGMNYSEADIMRRLISKKKPIEINQVKKAFFTKSKAKNNNLNLTMQIWEDIIKFAGYGFNKSHAIAYATISYWMAFLKVNYSFEFFNALLSSCKLDIYKTQIVMAEARTKYGITIQSPNLNLSNHDYQISGNVIIAPLSLIRGVGKIIIENIKKDIIKNGLFGDYLNTCIRLFKLGISKTVILNLIKAGALGNQKLNTTAQIANLDLIETYYKLGNDSTIPEPKIQNEKDNVVNLARWENEALGFNISRSIIQILEHIEKKTTLRKFYMIKNFPNVELPVIVYIKNKEIKKTKRGENMLVLLLNDDIQDEKIYFFGEEIEKITKLIHPGMYCKLLLKQTPTIKGDSYLVFVKLLKIYNLKF